MTQRIAVLLVAAFVPYLTPQSASQKLPGKPKSDCQLTPDDYAVYAALVVGLGGPEEAWKGKQILIVDVTAAPLDTKSRWGPWGFRSKSKAAPSHETVVDFERKACSSCVFKIQFGDTTSYKIITQGTLGTIFKGGSWEDFYKQYPDAGGVWRFSRPGFNSARNEAVLSVSHACGELCGAGHLYFLVKRSGQWKVQNRLMLWIS